MSRSRDQLEGESEVLRGRTAALEDEACRFEPARATPGERQRVEARLAHLSSVLKAVRNVNQLILMNCHFLATPPWPHRAGQL